MSIKNEKRTGRATPKAAFVDGTTPDPAFSAEPNIKFIGRGRWNPGKTKRSPAPDPIENFRDGDDEVDLPPAEFQISRRLFYHNDAGRIVRLFPQKYKRIIRRGSDPK